MTIEVPTCAKDTVPHVTVRTDLSWRKKTLVSSLLLNVLRVLQSERDDVELKESGRTNEISRLNEVI